MALTIVTSEVHGEPGSGYEGPEHGPFRCSNCDYFRNNSCGQRTMMRESKLPKTENGRVIVSEDGCCSYFETKPKKAKHWMGNRRKL